MTRLAGDSMILDEPEVEEILTAAEMKWGVELQQDTAVEEHAELIQAVSRRRRGRISDDEVAEEIADVLLAANHLALMYGVDDVRRHLDEKIRRLRRRVEEGERP